MYRFAISNKQSFLLLVAALALPLSATTATAADSSAQPITITADSAQLSRPDNVSTYTGHVVLVRGGLTLTGIKLVINRVKQNAYRAELTGAPATLERAAQSEDDALITGHGDRIIYFSNSSELTLRGDAVVKRAGDVIHSDVIHHDLDTQRTVAGDDSSDKDRVKITLHPGDDGAIAQP